MVSLSIRFPPVAVGFWAVDDETFESYHPQPFSAMLRHTITYILISAQLGRVWINLLDQFVLDQLVSKHAQDCSTGERLRLVEWIYQGFILISFACLAVIIRHSGINLRHVECTCTYFFPLVNISIEILWEQVIPLFMILSKFSIMKRVPLSWRRNSDPIILQARIAN